MRSDYIVSLNESLMKQAQHISEVIAMYEREIELLKKYRATTENMASTEKRVDDPSVGGDREPVPSMFRQPAPILPSVRDAGDEMEKRLKAAIVGEKVPA